MTEPYSGPPHGSIDGLATLLARVRAGDASAENDLLARVEDRIRLLTRRMLRDYPIVHRWEQTDDVMQRAVLRLHRSLRAVEVVDAQHFFRLAASQVRRVLLTLAAHYRGRIVAPPGADEGHSSFMNQAAESTSGPGELACWTEFHTTVGLLPTEQREVVDLLFYQGLSQEEAAEILGVSDRTVRTRWRRARLELLEKLGGRLPVSGAGGA